MSPENKDRYGRLIAELFTLDGQSINLLMIQTGNAWWYQKYAPRCEECRRLEEKARRKELGLWSLPQSIPPWEWRKGVRGRR